MRTKSTPNSKDQIISKRKTLDEYKQRDKSKYLHEITEFIRDKNQRLEDNRQNPHLIRCTLDKTRKDLEKCQQQLQEKTRLVDILNTTVEFQKVQIDYFTSKLTKKTSSSQTQTETDVVSCLEVGEIICQTRNIGEDLKKSDVAVGTNIDLDVYKRSLKVADDIAYNEFSTANIEDKTNEIGIQASVDLTAQSTEQDYKCGTAKMEVETLSIFQPKIKTKNRRVGEKKSSGTEILNAGLHQRIDITGSNIRMKNKRCGTKNQSRRVCRTVCNNIEAITYHEFVMPDKSNEQHNKHFRDSSTQHDYESATSVDRVNSNIENRTDHSYRRAAEWTPAGGPPEKFRRLDSTIKNDVYYPGRQFVPGFRFTNNDTYLNMPGPSRNWTPTIEPNICNKTYERGRFSVSRASKPRIRDYGHERKSKSRPRADGY